MKDIKKLTSKKPSHRGGGHDGVNWKVKSLYSRCLSIVWKEVEHLKTLSIAEKLESKYAGDLIGYVKLLGEMKKQQQDIFKLNKEAEEKALSEIPDEELEAKVKELIKKGKKKCK